MLFFTPTPEDSEKSADLSWEVKETSEKSFQNLTRNQHLLPLSQTEKSDLPVQSLPTRSWSFVVWQILTSLQSFAQIPHPPPPPPPRHHLQLLGTGAQCSCTRRDSAGCSRAGGPGGSSHTVTLSLSWRSLPEVDMGQTLLVGCKEL